MSVDQIAELRLLNDFLLAIVGQLSKLGGMPEQQLAREIVALFDILVKAEDKSSRILSSLNDFQKEKTVGMRVFYIHRVGQALNEFSNSFMELFLWAEKRENLSNALQILTPNRKEILSGPVDPDSLFTTLKGDLAYFNLVATIDVLKTRLQAVKSPDPEKFPEGKFVLEIIDQFTQILLQIEKSKQLIRKFAIDNLVVESFF